MSGDGHVSVSSGIIISDSGLLTISCQVIIWLYVDLNKMEMFLCS